MSTLGNNHCPRYVKLGVHAWQKYAIHLHLMKYVIGITLLLITGCQHTGDEISPSRFFGTWTGIEHFNAELSDEEGDVPFCLCEEDLAAFCEKLEDVKCEPPEGEVELTLVLAEDGCSISKFDEAAKDCVFDIQQMAVFVKGGMYGAHYESGYRIAEFTDQELIINSTLSNWVKEERYSYTYHEYSNGVLERQN